MSSDASLLSLAHQGHKGWTQTSSAYSESVGSTTAIAAIEHVSLLDERLPLSGSSARLADLGAGTGSLTLEIARRFPSLPLVAADISEGMLVELRKARTAQLASLTNQGGEREEKDLVTTQVFDLCNPNLVDSGLKPGAFTHVTSAYVLQVVLDPRRAVRNIYDLLRGAGSGSGDGRGAGAGAGVAALAIWDFGRRCDPHNIWEQAAAKVNPAYKPPPRNITNEIMTMEDLETIMRDVGFVDVAGVVKRFHFVDPSRPGKDGVMHFYWTSNNPMALERMQSFEGHGSLDDVREEMGKLIDSDYGGGAEFYVDLAFVLGSKK